MLFYHADVDFENIEIPMHQWPKIKPSMPGKTLPVLEFPDGKKCGQTVSILRLLGRQHGYYPADPLVGYYVD